MCRNRGLKDLFRCIPLLAMEWSLLLRKPQLMPLLIFAARTQYWLTMLLNGQDNRQNCPFRWRSRHHGSLGPIESVPKRHLDRFSRFCKAYECDQQTHRYTDRPRYSVGRNSPHLMQCIRCGLKWSKVSPITVGEQESCSESQYHNHGTYGKPFLGTSDTCQLTHWVVVSSCLWSIRAANVRCVWAVVVERMLIKGRWHVQTCH